MDGSGDEFIPPFARGLKILVVDHDTMSLMNMAWTLEQFNFKVTTTEMGSVALAMIDEAEKDRSFDMVIVNVDMIDMSILEFIRILIKKNIHVILTTTSAHTEMAVKGLNEGASIFYEKPVCLDDLKYIWQHVCKRNRNLTELVSNSGAEQERKGEPGRKPKNNLELEEPSGSVKVPKKRGRKPKNKEAGGEVEVIDCAAGHQEVADDPKGKSKVSEEEEFPIISDNDYQSKKIRAYTFNGRGDLLMLNDPKGKAKEVEEGARLIEVHDKPKETPNSGIGPMNINSKNKAAEVGMEREQIISMSELEKENEEKNMIDKIMIIAGEKKSHIIWNKELHFKFTTAVSLLGDKAVPTTILETMNVPNLTLRQVASHLQKYKKQIKKIGNATAGPKSLSFNSKGFQQALEMTGLHAHEQSRGGDITQSLQKPVALYNSTIQDTQFNFNERMKLATLYINAQSQNQPVLPFQGSDTLPNFSLKKQVLLPMQGLNAIPENVSSGNNLLMPVQGLDTLHNVSSGNQVMLPMQGLDAVPGNVSSGNQLLMPVQGLDTLPNVSSGNQVLLPMQGLDAIPENVSSGNQLPMSVQGLDTLPNVSSGNQLLMPVQGLETLPNISSKNQVLLPMQGLDAIPENVSSENNMLMPVQGSNAKPRQDSPKNPSMVENYLINFLEENKDGPDTNVPAAPSTWPGNQHHQQKSIDCYEFLNFLEEDGDLDQYFEFTNLDLV